MSLSKCPTCKEFVFDGIVHRCEPIYYFKHENWGEEFQEIRAIDFDDAAEKFAKLYNEDGDYSLMNGDTEEVIISDGKTEKKYKVSAEQAIEYHVEEVV
jgi:hypothetical protein